MRRMLTSLAELAGGVLLTVAAFTVGIGLGLAALGALLIAVGVTEA